MSEVKDLWYIRLPDGRILRAAGTAVIRQQFDAGRLPPGTRIRRSIDDAWKPVERLAQSAPTPQVNGSAPSATIASRLDPARLRLAGVRPLIEELLGALDSAACASKLRAAALAGALLGALFAVGLLFPTLSPWLAWGLAGGAVLVWSGLGMLIGRMTFTEVSRLRPATWRDGIEGGIGGLVHLALAQGIVLTILGGTIFGLRLLPSLVPDSDSGPVFALLADATGAFALVLEFLLWPIFLLMLPLPTVAVIEQGSFVWILRRWLTLVWRRTGRLLLAEVLALGIGLVIAGPLGLLGLLVSGRGETVGVEGVAVTRAVLLGLLTGVFLAYLVVANVFIYLNLRYDSVE